MSSLGLCRTTLSTVCSVCYSFSPPSYRGIPSSYPEVDPFEFITAPSFYPQATPWRGPSDEVGSGFRRQPRCSCALERLSVRSSKVSGDLPSHIHIPPLNARHDFRASFSRVRRGRGVWVFHEKHMRSMVDRAVRTNLSESNQNPPKTFK